MEIWDGAATLLCSHFVRPAWYWEVVELTRHFALVCALSFIPPGSGGQASMALVVCIAYGFLFAQNWPYAHTAHARLGLHSYVMLLVATFLTLSIKAGSIADQRDTWGACRAATRRSLLSPLPGRARAHCPAAESEATGGSLTVGASFLLPSAPQLSSSSSSSGTPR